MSKRIASIGAVVAFAAITGAGLAGGSSKPTAAPSPAAQQQQATKVTVCHKDRVTIRIAPSAVTAHKAHGDQLGACKS